MSEYPLSEHRRDRLRTPTGLPFHEITLDAVLEGKVQMADLRVTAQALELQAQVADHAGRRQLGENLRRAAELVDMPEDEILKVYTALRPGRCSTAELHAIADRIESVYGATLCAALIREAVT
jgi:propanediol dehydratase small subunit